MMVRKGCVSGKGCMFLIVIGILLFTGVPVWGGVPQGDTVKLLLIPGRVVDAEGGGPVMFASVFVEGTHVGTVSNSEGYFLLKVPLRYRGRKVVFSSIGYRTVRVPAELLVKADNVIRLHPDVIPLEPVVVEKLDPLKLLAEARSRIGRNYGREAAMMTAFYRESVRKRSKYLSVGEAVLDIYKAPYTGFADDRVRIYKGRKAEYVTKEDTLMMKLQGGPATIVQLDLVKHPGDILTPSALSYYDFAMGGEVMIDGRRNWVIRFDQKDTVSLPLFRGNIYLDKETLALSAVEFSLSPKQIGKAAPYMVVRKPAGLKVEVLGASYLVKYRYDRRRWVLNYMRTESRFSCKWENRLFRSTYTITSEAAITGVDFRHVERPRWRETSRPSDIFIEEISAFSDPTFWGSDNVIRPEESIESAVRRIRRKLKRRGED